MSQTELLIRFGDPAIRISGEGAEQTLFYSQKDGHLARVRVSGDHVAAVVE